MSMYSDGEICGDCQHSVMYDCGSCLKECKIGKEDEKDHLHGTCEHKEKDKERRNGPNTVEEAEEEVEIIRRLKDGED